MMLLLAAVHESASLIGRLGSSAFRPSTAAASMSLAGSCFSTESAHGPLYGAFLVKKFKQGSASFSITLFFVGCESPFLLPDPGFVRTTLFRPRLERPRRRSRMSGASSIFLVHSIAFSPKEALQGRVVDVSREGFLTLDVSCWTFIRMAHLAEALKRKTTRGESSLMLCIG
jgi:hypothetical protein